MRGFLEQRYGSQALGRNGRGCLQRRVDAAQVGGRTTIAGRDLAALAGAAVSQSRFELTLQGTEMVLVFVTVTEVVAVCPWIVDAE